MEKTGIDYEKILSKIADIRSNILQEYEKIKQTKQDALLVLKEELASYKSTIKNLEDMQKHIEKA